MDPRKRNEVPQSETKEQKNKKERIQSNAQFYLMKAIRKWKNRMAFILRFFMFEKNKDWKKEVSTERATYFSHSTVIL